MSSTAGLQNLLVNVFRPVYSYDPAAVNGIFVPKLQMSNIDTYSGNSISVFTAAVGDSASNVYVGSNAGNPYTNIRACSNTTAMGFGAGSSISNVSNSVYLGFNAGTGVSNSSSVIGIGANAGGATGTSNIFIGTGTKSTGSGNILIGHGINIGAGTNTFRVGSTLYGDLSTNWIGIGTNNHADENTRLDVNGNTYILGQVGVNIIPGNRTLDVNGDFRAQDASANVLDFTGGVTRSSGGFSSFRGSVLVQNNSNAPLVDVPLRNGLIMVAVASGPTNFDGRTSFVLDSTIGTVSNLSSNKSASTEVNFGANSISISNTTGANRTYTFNVTYFPLP